MRLEWRHGTRFRFWCLIHAMESLRSQINDLKALQIAIVCVALVVLGPLQVESESQIASRRNAASQSPAGNSSFPCIRSWNLAKSNRRVAILHGPDWVLKSSIVPSCLPEREVVFSAELDRKFLPHAFVARTKLWVSKQHYVTQVRIVESSGEDKQDLIAVSFVTNRMCIGRKSENCIIKGGALLTAMD